MEKLTWADVGNSARWVRDEAGAFVASFWMIAAMYGIGFWLASVWFKIDAEFSRPLAGGVIPADVTQQFSWTILAFSMIVGMAAVWCHERGMKTARFLLTVLGGIAAVILLLHAYGLSAKIIEQQYARAEANIGAVKSVQTSKQAQIDDIADEIKDADDARDAALRVAQDTIEGVRDPVAGFSAADNETIRAANDDKADALAAHAATVKRLQDERRKLRGELATAEGETQQAEVESSFNELFTLMARVRGQKWDPAKDPLDAHQYWSGVLFFFLFWGFGKLLMMTIFTLAFQMQLRAAKDARNSRRSRKGWQTKKSEPKAEDTDLTIEDNGYWRSRIDKALKTRLKKPTPSGMLNSYFSGVATVAELRTHLKYQMDEKGTLSQQEFDFIMREGPYAAPLPEQYEGEQSTNGVDKTTHEDNGDDTGSNADDINYPLANS